MSPKPIFLYLFRFQQFHHPLADLESQALLKQAIKPDQRFVTSHKKVDVTRSAFIDWGIEIFASGKTLQELCDRLKPLEIEVQQARVEYPSAGLHPDVTKEDLFEVLEFVEGDFNLKHPQERYVLTRDHNLWYFGKIHSSHSAKFLKHRQKPATFSSALNAATARTVINCLLDAGSNFLDCGCGSGSVTLEACDSGLQVTAIDRSYQAIGMTRENVAHFGYEARIEQKDLMDWNERHDSAVIDFPYGFSCKRDEEDEIKNIHHLFPLVKEVVFIASSDLTPLMTEIGYQILNQKVMKYPNVTRYIIHAKAGRRDL